MNLVCIVCRDTETIKADNDEFKIHSSFSIDSDTLNGEVLVIENYGEPLLIDNMKKRYKVLEEDVNNFVLNHSKGALEDKALAAQEFYSYVDANFKDLLLQNENLFDEIERKITVSLPEVYGDKEDMVQDKILIDKINSLTKMPVGEDDSEITKLLTDEVLSFLEDKFKGLKEAKIPKENMR